MNSLPIDNDMLDNVFDITSNEMSDCCFHLGNVYSRHGLLSQALKCWSDAFFTRGNCNCHDDSLQWKMFYDIQFNTYVYGKKRACLSLPEGDMIHDLIRSSWLGILEDLSMSDFQFAPTDLNEWFSSVKVDFPWELEEEEWFTECMDLSACGWTV